jgi:hypothetical protein
VGLAMEWECRHATPGREGGRATATTHAGRECEWQCQGGTGRAARESHIVGANANAAGDGTAGGALGTAVPSGGETASCKRRGRADGVQGPQV